MLLDMLMKVFIGLFKRSLVLDDLIKYSNDVLYPTFSYNLVVLKNTAKKVYLSEPYYTLHEDGKRTLIIDINSKEIIHKDKNHRNIYYSYDEFKEKIVYGESCFICGAERGTKKFNDEHIFPKRLLSYAGLLDKSIIVLNKSPYSYSKFTISCCEECNSMLGTKVETPMSKLIQGGYDAFMKEMYDNPDEIIQLVYIWLCMIFFKIVMKDKSLKKELKSTSNDTMIHDIARSDFHHIHCIVRSIYTGADIKKVIGTICVLPMSGLDEQTYDFKDFFDGQSLMLRIGDIGIVAVLNDVGVCGKVYKPQLDKISGPLTNIQLSELFCYLSAIRLAIKNNITFHSNFVKQFNGDIRDYKIELDNEGEDIEFIDDMENIIPRIRGNLMEYYMKEVLNLANMTDLQREQLRVGRRSFLWEGDDCHFKNYNIE